MLLDFPKSGGTLGQSVEKPRGSGPRDCPRASPSGNLSGLGVQNLRPWEISWASGSVFSNTSLLSAVYGYIVTGQFVIVVRIPLHTEKLK